MLGRNCHWAEQNITYTIIAPSPNSCTKPLKALCTSVQPHQHAKMQEFKKKTVWTDWFWGNWRSTVDPAILPVTTAHSKVQSTTLHTQSVWTYHVYTTQPFGSVCVHTCNRHQAQAVRVVCSLLTYKQASEICRFTEYMPQSTIVCISRVKLFATMCMLSQYSV